MPDIVSIGLTGVTAALEELAITSSNIANASNPNYSAESVSLAAISSGENGSAGVEVTGIERAQVPFLNPQINDAQSNQDSAAAFSRIAQSAESYLAPQLGLDLGGAAQKVLSDFLNLSGSPEDLSLRQGLLTDSQALAGQSQSIDTGIAQLLSNSISGLPALVAEVNSQSKQLAQINAQISQSGAQAQGGGSITASLQDQRDALLQQLASLIGAHADANGNISAGGVPLVDGGTAFTLSLTTTSGDPVLTVNLPDGAITAQNTSLGGKIGGSLSAIEAVTALRQKVDGYIDSLANAINAKQQAGYDLNGNPGQALFSVPSTPAPISLTANFQASQIAAASTAAGAPGDGSNAAAIGQLQDASGFDSDYPTATPGQAWSQITGDFGLSVQTASTEQSQSQALLQSLQQLRSSVSGVSINEELTRLLQYQNALEAAGRAVSVGTNVIQFLLQQL